MQCKCRKGHASQYDNKCGHCRTKQEKYNLEKTLRHSGNKTLNEIKKELELRNSGLHWMI